MESDIKNRNEIYELKFMIGLVYGLYVENRKQVEIMIAKIKQSKLSYETINTIAEFMKEIQPTMKLFYIFAEFLKPLFIQVSLLHNNKTIS